MGFSPQQCKSAPTATLIIAMSVIALLCIYALNSKQMLVFKCEPTEGVPQLIPDSEKLYARAVNNLRECLDTTNLTKYFRQENLLETAVLNVKAYLDAIHRFIPHKFIDTLPNHCWNAPAKLDIGTTVVSGHVSETNFRVNRTDIKNWTLNTVPRFDDYYVDQEFFLPMSCIPEVFTLGFQKCGSTYVLSLLKTHPKFNAIAIRKEPSWFIGRRHDFMDESAQQSMYFADYVLNFIPLSTKPAILVDGSSAMIFDWPDFFKQQRIVNYCLLPSVFPQVLPRAKFIVVMRDPVAMLYSLFWFSYTLFREEVPSRDAQLKAPTLFHDTIVKKISDINSCIEVFPLAKCLVESSPTSELLTNILPDQGGISIYESVYYIHIQKWLSVVPRERFLFLKLEDLSTNIDHAANEIWNFVGVDSLRNIRATLKKHADKNEEKIIAYQHDPNLAMRNDTKELLRNFFQPYNHMLAEFLGDRKFLWEN